MAAFDFDKLIKQIKDSQKEANAANLKRYGEMMTHFKSLLEQVGAQGTYGEASRLMETMGTAGRQRISEQAIKAQAATEQDLMTRGLASTTIRTTAQRGISADAERARQELEEKVALSKAGVTERRAGAEMQIGGMKAGAMERRADVGPDLALYASLMKAAAATGGPTPTAPKRTATIMGPMAMAGRDVFGRQMGRFGGGGGGISGGGGGGGGQRLAAPPPSGAIGGGWNIGGATGAARGVDPVTGRFTGLGGGGLGGGGATELRPTEGYAGMGGMGAADVPTEETMPEPSPSGAAAIGATVAAAEEETREDFITDYAEYKKLAGSGAVSPMYFHQVWGGRVKRSQLPRSRGATGSW